MAKDKSKKHQEHETTDEHEHLEHGSEIEQKEEKPEASSEEREGEESPTVAEHNAKQHWFARHWQWLLDHKWVSIPLAIVLLHGILAAIPFTRFTLAGLVLKQNFQVEVLDSQTQKPVSSALVTIAGQEAETNGEGIATVRAKVGYAKLEVTKKYYHSASSKVVVPIAKQKTVAKIELLADGRPVPVTVLNSISGKPITDATITAGESEAKTDAEGKATLVLPADKKDASITITGDGFNIATATLTVTSDEIDANIFTLTPSGKIYFLSNASGKIDLVKSNLDGTERQTVLAGTGKEDKYNTVLLASRDWKYIALLSKRDGGDYAKLFLIEAENDKVTVMDEGEATFDLYGWSDDRLIYAVDRQKVKYWEPKRFALKSYHTPTKKITTLDETTAEGNVNVYGYQYFYNSIYVLGDSVVYSKNWAGGSYYLQGKQATFNSIKADGSQKQTIKTFSDTSIESRTGDFGEIKILYVEAGAAKVDVYRDGKLSVGASKSEEFYNESYPTYSVSPSAKKTLWSDYRDGKEVVFVGDSKGENGQEIGRSDEFTIYGWFTDDYILLTKKGSELRILPANGLETNMDKAAKVSDYYKPNYQDRGFGYGYGG